MSALWGRLPLWAKIVLPYFLLTMVVGVGGTYVATRLAAQSANDRLTTALVEAVRTADAELAEREGERLGALLTLADRPDLARAVESRDVARVDAQLDPLPEGASWAAAVALDGTTLASRRTTGGFEDVRRALSSRTAPPNVGPSPPVTLALQGMRDFTGELQGGVGDLGGEPALVAAAPLKIDERVVGAVVVGSDLSAVTTALKRATLADVALFGPDGAPIVNTLAPDAPARGSLPSLATLPEGDQLLPIEMRQGDRDYHALVGPLRVRDQTVGALSVALPADAVARVGADTRTLLTWLFGGAMVLSVGLGFVIAGLIARPVNRLAAVAQAVGEGDLSRRTRIATRDEIGTLARAFDRMTSSLANRQEELAGAYLNTVRALAAAIDAKDPYTHGHSQRVAAYSVMAARRLGVDEATIREIEMGGLLHDVGKIGVPDGVLTKPGKLDDEEWAYIRKHPGIGAEILRPVGFGPLIMDFVLYHHERLNGRGFPEGLRGDAIPLVARIAAVADAYDAMTSNRSYRRALEHEVALSELRKGAGEQFDPACVDALIACLPDGPLPSADAAREEAQPVGS